jgi:hypothetical protein
MSFGGAGFSPRRASTLRKLTSFAEGGLKLSLKGDLGLQSGTQLPSSHNTITVPRG